MKAESSGLYTPGRFDANRQLKKIKLIAKKKKKKKKETMLHHTRRSDSVGIQSKQRSREDILIIQLCE